MDFDSLPCALVINEMKGRTSFVIAHRLSTIREAANVLVIQCGGIVENSAHQLLLELREVYTNLYQGQFKGIEYQTR